MTLPSPNKDRDQQKQHPPRASGGWGFLALLIAIGVTLLITIYPHAAARDDGSPDMMAAALMFWAMSAGFVRGVGFIPHNKILAAIFSLPAALLALAAGVARLYLF
ncbi:MAG: cyd operon YbgE family protein [Alphaproteobacteria bacterium]